MKVLEAVAKGLALVGKNMKLFLILVVINIILTIVAIPLMIMIFGPAALQAGPGGTLTPDQLATINWALLAIVVLVSALIQIFVNGGVVGTIKEIIKTNSMKLGGFFNSAKNLFVRYLLLAVLVFLVAAVAVLVVFLASLILSFIGSKIAALGVILGVILGIVALVVVVMMAIYVSYWPIVIAVEDKRTIESLGITSKFLKGKMLRSIGLGAIYFAVLIVIAIVNNLLVRQGGVLTIAAQIISGLVNLYLTTAFVASLMYFYMGNDSKKASSTMV